MSKNENQNLSKEKLEKVAGGIYVGYKPKTSDQLEVDFVDLGDGHTLRGQDAIDFLERFPGHYKDGRWIMDSKT